MTIPESPNEDATPLPRALPGAFTGPVTGPLAGTVAAFSPRATVEAYQTVAWRAPGATRFDGRPANDFLARAEALVPTRIYQAPAREPQNAPAGLFTFAVGALIATVLGALLGAVLSV